MVTKEHIFHLFRLGCNFVLVTWYDKIRKEWLENGARWQAFQRKDG